MDVWSKEIETERHNQRKTLVIEVNTDFDKLINKINTTKKIIIEHENRPTERMQNETQGEKRVENKTRYPRALR